MEECVYFTRRQLNEKGKVVCWVFREKCPKCNKALMGKPVDSKTGKPKIRAKIYICPECGYEIDKREYEDSLIANIQYTCPKCGYEGEIQVPFKRKKIKGVDTLRFQCEKCKSNIDITKKMVEK